VRLGLLVVLGGATESSVAQTDADYLKSLEGEAESVALDAQTEFKTTASKKSTSAAGSKGVPSSLVSGLAIEQFERVLQQNYIGSYLFYKRLSSSQKDEVYASYQGNPDPDSVRDKILKMSKK